MYMYNNVHIFVVQFNFIGWILNNKEWLFSGAGLTIIASMISLLFLIITIKKVKFKIKVDATFTNDDKTNLT